MLKLFPSIFLAVVFVIAIFFGAEKVQADATAISGSCSAVDNTVYVGDPVTWNAFVVGGTGSSDSSIYSWSGSEGLSSTNQTVTKTYTTAGTKNAAVSIVYGDRALAASCSVTVIDPTPVPNLSVSCSASANGNTVTWDASATGGTGNFSYSWNGTDNFSGNNQTITKTYTTSGTKTASVSVTSGNYTEVANCSVVINIEPPVNNLSGSCAVSPTTAYIGQNVTWTASASGGTGSYSYSWSGSNNLSSNNKNAYMSYGTSGTKTATVVITSGNNSISRTCSVYVEPSQEDDDLQGSCYADPDNIEEGERIEWTASASGGTGSYSYSWDGTDGLSGYGRYISERYDRDGRKTAYVTITSGDQSITRSCSAYVESEDNYDDDLDVYCEPDDEEYEVGDRITWRAYVSGGAGSYDYDWDGTDNLRGSNRTVSKTYNSDGRKRATVEVTDRDGNRETATCRIDVVDDEDIIVTSYPDNTPFASGVFLSQIPYTGIKGGYISIIGFILGLLAWSFAVVYFIVYRNKYSYATQSVSGKEKSTNVKNIEDSLRSKARRSGVIISEGAIEEIVTKSNGDMITSLTKLNKLMIGKKDGDVLSAEDII